MYQILLGDIFVLQLFTIVNDKMYDEILNFLTHKVTTINICYLVSKLTCIDSCLKCAPFWIWKPRVDFGQPKKTLRKFMAYAIVFKKYAY